jgi:hypothetical protein
LSKNLRKAFREPVFICGKSHCSRNLCDFKSFCCCMLHRSRNLPEIGPYWRFAEGRGNSGPLFIFQPIECSLTRP